MYVYNDILLLFWCCYCLVFSSPHCIYYKLSSAQIVGLNGQPSWCAQDPVPVNDIVLSFGTDDEPYQQKITDRNSNFTEMMTPFLLYLVVSLIFTLSDIIISLAAWNAASVGTPCESTGRDKALRPLFWIKMTFMNCLLAVVLASGIYFVAEGRRTNYGCEDGDQDVIDRFEVSFCLCC